MFVGKTKEGDGRFDRAAWKVMQVTMNDTAKFVDMLHNVPWEDGLPDDVVQGKATCYTMYHGRMGYLMMWYKVRLHVTQCTMGGWAT